MKPKYKRVLLKVSGEALAGSKSFGLDEPTIASVTDTIKTVVDMGVEVAIVVGAGNIWRGRQGGSMNRVRADSMGMLATTINSIALQDTFIQCGLKAKVMTAVNMEPFAERFSAPRAIEAMQDGNIVIFGGGLGSPYFSTDTAASLRAAEIEADALLMAKNIDGIYSADPKIDPTAVRYDEITYKDIISKELKALDLSAATFCMENNITVYAFGLKDPMNIYRAVMGEKVGTELHK